MVAVPGAPAAPLAPASPADRRSDWPAPPARRERRRITLGEIGRGSPVSGAEQLPAGLLDIIERSLALHQRVVKFDAMMGLQGKTEATGNQSPVSSQIDRIAAVFNARS